MRRCAAAWSGALALGLFLGQAGEARAGASPHLSEEWLPSSNGLAAIAWDREQFKLVQFLEHPYTAASSTTQTRNFLYDSYPGIRLGTTGTWLDGVAPVVAEYLPGTGIVHSMRQLSGLQNRRVRLHPDGAPRVRQPDAGQRHADGRLPERGRGRRVLALQLPARHREPQPRGRLGDAHLRRHPRRLLRERPLRRGDGLREHPALELPRLHAQQPVWPAQRRLQPDGRSGHGRAHHGRRPRLPDLARHARGGRQRVGRLGHRPRARRQRLRPRSPR